MLASFLISIIRFLYFQHESYCFVEEEEDILKIVVPEGVVVGLDSDDFDSIKWKHKVIFIYIILSGSIQFVYVVSLM